MPGRSVVLLFVGLLICLAGGSATAFELQSPAFSSGGGIPVKHTCDGPNLSPSLRWAEPSPKTRGFALIVDDPDAPGGSWIHWVLYGIPATVRELPEGVTARDTVAGTGAQGVNDFGKVGYGGPCPPRGPAHRYFFKLYALDTEQAPPPRKSTSELLKAMEGHVLGQAELIGRYKRK